MMMIGGFCPPSAADSYEVYDILMGSSLALNGRRVSFSKHVMDRNDLDLIMVAAAEWDFGT
jgi:predicted ester cyclase